MTELGWLVQRGYRYNDNTIEWENRGWYPTQAEAERHADGIRDATLPRPLARVIPSPWPAYPF